jgi:hypothetical protein
MRKGSRMSQESRAKISAAGRRRRHSAETKAKISQSHMKEKNPQWGKPLTPETKAKISKALMGTGNPQYGKRMKPEHLERLKAMHQGKPLTQEHKANMSRSLKGRRPYPGSIEKNSGANCHLWRGGVSFEPYCPKFNNNLKLRIRAFFDYNCLTCGKSTEDN